MTKTRLHCDLIKFTPLKSRLFRQNFRLLAIWLMWSHSNVCLSLIIAVHAFWKPCRVRKMMKQIGVFALIIIFILFEILLSTQIFFIAFFETRTDIMRHLATNTNHSNMTTPTSRARINVCGEIFPFYPWFSVIFSDFMWPLHVYPDLPSRPTSNLIAEAIRPTDPFSVHPTGCFKCVFMSTHYSFMLLYLAALSVIPAETKQVCLHW